jgi:aminoglycoside phosphotransferase (APT) family kinase protein
VHLVLLTLQPEADEGAEPVSYGPEKYQRSVRAEEQIRVTNLFRLNQNIKPMAHLQAWTHIKTRLRGQRDTQGAKVLNAQSEGIRGAMADEVLTHLTRLVRVKTGYAGARAHSLETLAGHASPSYSFVLERGDAGSAIEKLVLRLPPLNVKTAGQTDIVRQARIMASMAGTAIPVPPVYWYGDEPEFFGRPYFVVGFLEGVKLADQPFSSGQKAYLARQGIETLATLHSLPWECRLQAFGDPVTLTAEMERLDRLLERSTPDPAVVARAPELRKRLRATMPHDAHVGCVHGDFHWANVLFNSERLVAVIDWERALIGPVLLDLGWICFFADKDSWNKTVQKRVRPLMPQEIVDTYAKVAPFAIVPKQVRWFWAFTCYRFGIFTCFNLMLFRRGVRTHRRWDEIALSAPRMFERGLELLGS